MAVASALSFSVSMTKMRHRIQSEALSVRTRPRATTSWTSALMLSQQTIIKAEVRVEAWVAVEAAANTTAEATVEVAVAAVVTTKTTTS